MVEIIAFILGIALLGVSYLLVDARARIKLQDDELTRKQAEIKGRNERFQDLNTQIETKNQVIEALQSGTTQKDETIATLKSSLNESQQMAHQIEAELSDKRELCTALQTRLDAYTEAQVYKQALLLTLANSSYDALIMLNHELDVIAINMTAEKLFPVDEPVGRGLTEVVPMPEIELMVKDTIRNAEDIFEEQVKVDDRFYRVQTRVVERDEFSFIGVAFQDITMLVRLNRARRDMVANISHELRHPIANIRLTIDALFHDQDKPKRKDSISSLRAIARETENLMWLVQEMSDLAMIESGQSIVRMVDVALPDLVDEAIERMQDQSEYKDITMVKHVPAKMRVLCDRDLARRVLINLIHNAIKWSPEKETITINAEDSGDDVILSVIDNGLGVPPEKVDRIFERFYQVDDSRSGGEGTGLGLAICKHIVEAHGGRIWAEGNLKGAGGRFLFTLLSAEDESEDTIESVEQES